MPITRMRALSFCMLPLAFLLTTDGFSHCDGLDGPVITAARKALESGDLKLALIWVQKANEGEVKSAFEKALAVRKISPSARELADNYFFKTLVRIHRAGEGYSFTGLKQAGRDLGPAIPAADKSIEKASPQALVQLLTDKMREGLQARYEEVLAMSRYDKDDVAAGRNYVNAYVEYIHYVEQLYESAKGSTSMHDHGSAE